MIWEGAVAWEKSHNSMVYALFITLLVSYFQKLCVKHSPKLLHRYQLGYNVPYVACLHVIIVIASSQTKQEDVTPVHAQRVLKTYPVQIILLSLVMRLSVCVVDKNNI